MNKVTSIQERLKALRTSKGLTQTDLGNILGMTAAGYGKLESEKRSALKPEHCIILSDFYGVSCDYIIRGIEAEKVDICANTCLTQQTIDALCKMQEDHKHRIREYQEFTGNAYPLEVDSSAFASDDELFEFIAQTELHDEIEWNLKNSLYGSTIVNYLVNAIILDKRFLPGLARACYKGVSAVLGDIYTTSRHIYNLDAKRDEFQTGLSAACYDANLIFGLFFSKLCKDADLVSSLFELSEDEIVFALENGLLDYDDD